MIRMFRKILSNEKILTGINKAQKKVFQAEDEKKYESFLYNQYSVLSDRRISHDELFWEVPLMFLTAQAFLLTIALGANTEWWGRTVAAFISMFFGFLSIQVFERDRVMEISDAEQLNEIEKYIIRRGYPGMNVHEKFKERDLLVGEKLEVRLEKKNLMTFLNRADSYSLWRIGMWMTTVISFFIFSIVIGMQFEIVQQLIKNINRQIFILIVIVTCINIVLCILDYIILKQKGKIKTWYLIICTIIILIIDIGTFIYVLNLSVDGYKIINSFWFLITLLPLVFFIINFGKGIFKRSKKKILETIIKKQEIIILVLAGGEAQRLSSVLSKGTPKFLALKSNGNTLLYNTIYRNMEVSSNQVIITNEQYYESIKKEEYNALKFVDYEFINKDNKVETSKDKKAHKANNIYTIIEPTNRGTGVAILNYITRDKRTSNEENEKENDPVYIIVPSDHIINDIFNYSYTVRKVCDLARDFNNIYLFGITPACISKEYGFFRVDNRDCYYIKKIVQFIEKPTTEEAEKMVEKGDCFWNSGIFIARESVLLEAYKNYCPEDLSLFHDNNSEKDIYEKVNYLSFDKCILEKSKNLFAVISDFDWMDIGNESTLQAAILDGYVVLNALIKN